MRATTSSAHHRPADLIGRSATCTGTSVLADFQKRMTVQELFARDGFAALALND